MAAMDEQDRLAEIKAYTAEHEYADGLSLDDVRWLVSEIEALRDELAEMKRARS